MATNSTFQTAEILHGYVTSNTTQWYEECLGMQRQARFGSADYVYRTAWDNWVHAPEIFKHHTPNEKTRFDLIPRGAYLFFRDPNPTGEDGHVEFYCGYGAKGPVSISNDVRNGNMVGYINPLWSLTHWNQTLEGWLETLENVIVPLALPHTRYVDLATIAWHFQNYKLHNDRPWVAYQIRNVQEALKTTVTGQVSSIDVAAYAAWQRACGYSGQDANGVPGSITLTKLGHLNQFEVIA